MGTRELLLLIGLALLWVWSRIESKRPSEDSETALENPTR
jgi:hypothetical protein